MTEYHKIQSVFKRDPGNMRSLLEGQWALPEFELLKDLEWIWTEKIDGTNIRVMWKKCSTSIGLPNVVCFGGKTDKAQIPTPLLETLQNIFIEDKMGIEFSDTEVCLYGEGYGKKIQKGGNYLPDATDFILFDCRIGRWWLTKEALEEIAERLSIKIVPIVGSGTLLEAVEYCKKGFKSTIAHNKDYDAEGLVLNPKLELFDRAGHRIITKIKTKDFNPLKK